MIKIKMKNLLTKHLKKILIFLAFLIMIICLGVKYYLVNKQDKVDKKSDNVGIISLEKKASNSNQNISKNKTSSKTPKVFVDIKGAIVRPGVYELEKEKRKHVCDSITICWLNFKWAEILQFCKTSARFLKVK